MFSFDRRVDAARNTESAAGRNATKLRNATTRPQQMRRVQRARHFLCLFLRHDRTMLRTLSLTIAFPVDRSAPGLDAFRRCRSAFLGVAEIYFATALAGRNKRATAAFELRHLQL
jgi:hypothetical protein